MSKYRKVIWVSGVVLTITGFSISAAHRASHLASRPVDASAPHSRDLGEGRAAIASARRARCCMTWRRGALRSDAT